MRSAAYDKLADELRTLGFNGMAERADQGVYSDFESDIAFPKMQLVEDLRASGSFNGVDVESLVKRVQSGEFDG